MQHEHHRVPVTALAFFGHDITLAGEGTYLHAYSASCERRQRVRLFDGQAIHGIIVHDSTSRILVWGGRFVRALCLTTNQDGAFRFDLGRVQALDDWILDACFSSEDFDCPPTAGIITAHNALSLARFGLQAQDVALDLSDSLIPGSNCILYSAHIIWLSASRCLIASGTAFGDVIVWSATINEKGGKFKAQSQVHYTFSAHEGSVFGVQLSRTLSPSLAGCTRMLASCSDDRTIRLWDVSDMNVQSPSLETLQRDTGFGARDTADTRAPQCVAKAMGHISRIWHVRYECDAAPGEQMRLLSFGEDASVITWVMKVDGASSSLHQIHVDTAHSGKNIWSVATRKDGIVTGGADGAIAFYTRAQYETVSNEIPPHFPNDCATRTGDNYRCYCFVDTSVLVSTTDQGRIMLITLDSTGGSASFQELSGPLSSLRGYSVVSGLSGHAFIAGAAGTIYHYSHGDNCPGTIGQESMKVAGLFVSRSGLSGDIKLLVTTLGATTATLYTVQDDSSDCTLLTLTLPSAFVVTAFAYHRADNNHCAVLGGRNGSMAVYSLDDEAKNISVPCSRLYSSVHGNEAVTSLQWSCSNTEHVLADYIFSTGRDGTLAVQSATVTDSRVELDLVHQLTLPFGPNIEGLSNASENKPLVWGFKSKHFIAHDVLAQREIMSVECGGAHRNWAFQPAEHGGTFVWTKSSKLYQKTQNELSYTLLNSGGHGREIKAAAMSSSTTRPQILATGAEDTDIKLYEYGKNGFRCLHTLRKHNTGIQHLQWSRNGQYLFSSGGFEEFFVWRVTPDVPCIGIGIQCESAHPQGGTSDIRVMGFDVGENCDATAFEFAAFNIAMAYSDSTLKLWHYSNKVWELQSAADYQTACLTNVLHLHGDEANLITTATDAHIALWQSQDSSKTTATTTKWSRRVRVHQSAIHVAIMYTLDDDSTLIVTGGDDNAIAFTRLGTDGSPQTLLISRAHAAAVTGLAFLPTANATFWLLSVSIDQRLKLWQVEVDTTQSGVDGIAVKRPQNCFTSVADASSLDICRLDDGAPGVVICGVGMEVWRLPPLTETIDFERTRAMEIIT